MYSSYNFRAFGFVKYSGCDGGFHYREQKIMVAPTSEKVTLPYYIIQPFTRQLFDAISSVQLLTT